MSAALPASATAHVHPSAETASGLPSGLTDVEHEPAGLLLNVRQSKTDQERHGQVVAELARQVGYSAADVLAKPLFGLLVLAIAIAKSRDEGYTEAGDTGSAQPTNAASARQHARP